MNLSSFFVPPTQQRGDTFSIFNWSRWKLWIFEFQKYFFLLLLDEFEITFYVFSCKLYHLFRKIVWLKRIVLLISLRNIVADVDTVSAIIYFLYILRNNEFFKRTFSKISSWSNQWLILKGLQLSLSKRNF